MYAYIGSLVVVSLMIALLQLNVRRCAPLEEIDAVLNLWYS